MTVTLETLLDEQHKAEQAYAPVPGTEYVIAENGYAVRLLAPTLARTEHYDALVTKQGQTYDAYKAEHKTDTVPIRVQLETVKRVVQAVTEPVGGGDWPSDDALFSNVLMRIGADFLRSSRRIYPPATRLSNQQSRLMGEIFTKLAGHDGGSAARAGATSS